MSILAWHPARSARHPSSYASQLCLPAFGEKPNAQLSRYAGDVRPVLNLAELAESVRSAPRRSADDVSITLDGRHLDSKEKVLAFLAEVEADRIAGRPVVDQLL